MRTPEGYGQDSIFPVGTIRIRTRRKRGGERRAYVKIAEPNKWVLLARYVWEQANGTIQRGMGIHHKDENKLNDQLDNLQLVSKAKHLAIHAPGYKEKRLLAFAKTRRRLRWSTRSKTKKTGRPPTFDPIVMKEAVAAYKSGEGSLQDVASRHHLSKSALGYHARKT